MALGLLLLRLLLAALLAGHACQKAFGWFRGQGIDGTARTFESWGFRPGRQHAFMATAAELTGAVLLALGLLTPLGSAVVVGTMTVAASANFKNGLWAHLGGYEVAFVYGALAFVIAVTGPGALSLDAAAGLPLSGIGYALGAAALGIVAALPPLLRRRQALRQPAG
ncbi:MAG: DoxX family protein [Acidothermales bacterium]|nr:DoxX family protein [Acidothermales bacterium]